MYTELGFPQGSTLSPTMYSLLANKLLCDLNKLTAFNGLVHQFKEKDEDDYDEEDDPNKSWAAKMVDSHTFQNIMALSLACFSFGNLKTSHLPWTSLI